MSSSVKLSISPSVKLSFFKDETSAYTLSCSKQDGPCLYDVVFGLQELDMLMLADC